MYYEPNVPTYRPIRIDSSDCYKSFGVFSQIADFVTTKSENSGLINSNSNLDALEASKPRVMTHFAS